jgi:plastocyanin
MQFGTKLITSGTLERTRMSEFLILKVVAAWLLISLSPAFASNVDVEMLNKRDDGAKMVYSLDIVDVEVGDTVTWLPTAKGHNVQFIAGPNSATLPK